jgi:hypothetical protein
MTPVWKWWLRVFSLSLLHLVNLLSVTVGREFLCHKILVFMEKLFFINKNTYLLSPLTALPSSPLLERNTSWKYLKRT